MKPLTKILVVKPSSIGDVVHSLPFLNLLSTCFPNAKIHWVIARGLEGLLEGHPMIDRLIVIDKDMWKKISRAGRTIREVRELYRMLRGERYDIAIDLQGLLRSGLIAMATQAPVRVGFSEAREGSRLFYTQKVRGGRDLHAVDRYLKVAQSLGCSSDEILFPFALFKENDAIRRLKRQFPRYAVIVPGARWATKIWPADSFGSIAAFLGMPSLIVGSAADAERAEKIVETSKGTAVSLVGRTGMKELIDVMRGASLVITNDSGPMHIAAGFRVPVVAVFGPTNPVRTGPYGQGQTVVASDLPCAPCYKKRCRDPKCMTSITPDRVIREMERAGLLTSADRH